MPGLVDQRFVYVKDHSLDPQGTLGHRVHWPARPPAEAWTPTPEVPAGADINRGSLQESARFAQALHVKGERLLGVRDGFLEVALMFGWIDGQLGKRDDATWTVRFTPHRPRGPWSKRKVGIVERLVGEGRMRPALAKGRAGPRRRPLGSGLPRLRPGAFDGLLAQNRYAILYRLTTAKHPETRARQLEQFIDMLAPSETIHPQRSRS